MVNKIKNLKEKKNKLMFLKDIALSLCLFFNPFGFDAVQYYLITLTGNIWKANLTLYCIAGLFFGCYILLSKKIKKEDNSNNI